MPLLVVYIGGGHRASPARIEGGFTIQIVANKSVGIFYLLRW